ncbi:late embryogenesis abundant protein Lea5 isoform X2 [Euphorbia lathyris]|uniref:late embryogenesis abundant protein Lea5 isoform X2 n=1 Tax=Euphorbia lathyris TaxID=212925 RepID=UPI003314092C
MSRCSLSNAKLLASSLSDAFSVHLFRGYAAEAHGSVSGRSYGIVGSKSGMVGKVEERAVIKEDTGASSAWAPDPVTGYYRPANRAADIDPAELREMLLNHRVRQH